jgi:hypothetical protein
MELDRCKRAKLWFTFSTVIFLVVKPHGLGSVYQLSEDVSP